MPDTCGIMSQPMVFRPWVDWAARRISDPVIRLRFLKALAPRDDLPTRRKGARLRILLLILLLACALVTFFRMRGAG